MPRPPVAVDQQNIRIAIVVVIDKRAAAAFRFGEELAAVAPVRALPGDARRRGNVDEMERRVGGRMHRAGRGIIVGAAGAQPGDQETQSKREKRTKKPAQSAATSSLKCV